MRNLFDSGNNFDLVPLRYSDWFLTCPLLLFEFFILMDFIKIKDSKLKIDAKDSINIIATIICSILMLIFGYLAETKTNYKWTFYSLGFISLVIMFLILINLHFQQEKNNPKYKNLPKYPWFFIAIWVLYGLAFIVPARDLFYNILDLIAKGALLFAVLFYKYFIKFKKPEYILSYL